MCGVDCPLCSPWVPGQTNREKLTRIPLPKELDSVVDYILGLISVKLQATLFGVRIRNFVHKGLKRF